MARPRLAALGRPDECAHTYMVRSAAVFVTVPGIKLIIGCLQYLMLCLMGIETLLSMLKASNLATDYRVCSE